MSFSMNDSLPWHVTMYLRLCESLPAFTFSSLSLLGSHSSNQNCMSLNPSFLLLDLLERTLIIISSALLQPLAVLWTRAFWAPSTYSWDAFHIENVSAAVELAPGATTTPCGTGHSQSSVDGWGAGMRSDSAWACPMGCRHHGCISKEQSNNTGKRVEVWQENTRFSKIDNGNARGTARTRPAKNTLILNSYFCSQALSVPVPVHYQILTCWRHLDLVDEMRKEKEEDKAPH